MVELQHAEDVLLEFDLHRHEVVDGVKSEQVAVGAPNEDVLFNLLWHKISHRKCASNGLVFLGFNLVLFFQRVHVKYIDLFVRAVTEKQLVLSILDVELCDRQTNMLGHLMHEFHLHHAPNFLALVPQNHLGDLLITHVGRSVDLRAKVLDFSDVLRLLSSNCSILNQ